jgi:hypothetical protein
MITKLLTSGIPHVNEITSYKHKNALVDLMPSHDPLEFNEKGFRSDSFLADGDIKVISIGCSDVFGFLLDKSKRFSDVFCKKLSIQTGKKVVNWNLGLPGKSNDYINRMIACTKEKLNPTIVLVSFPRITRREWVDKNGVFYDYLPYHDNVTSPHFDFLSNYNQNILNFYLNYKSIEANLKDVNFMFTFSLARSIHFDVLNVVDKNKYVGYFECVDRASDDTHPGEISNYNLAESFLKKYNENVHC